MKPNRTSLLALIVGIGLGSLITKGLDGSSGSDIMAEENTGPQRELRVRPRGGGSRGANGGRDGRTNRSELTSSSLDALLNHAAPFYAGQPDPALYMTIGGLDAGQISALIGELGQSSNQDFRADQIRSALFKQWAKLDLEGALDAVGRIKNNHLGSQAISSIMSSIALSDPIKAREILDTMEPGDIRDSALKAYIGVAASEDPMEAFRLLQEGTRGGRHNNFYSTLFHAWAREHPEMAISMLGEIEGQQGRQSAQKAIVRVLASTDQERALEFANGLTSLSERRNAMNNLVDVLTSEDPQRALKLLDHAPPRGSTHLGMIHSIASSWIIQDSDAALAWMETLPPYDRASAISSAVSSLDYNNPEKAA